MSNTGINQIVSIISYLLLAPLVGGLLAGVDRKISARFQGRIGPPLLQPFYDVLKLIGKENTVVNVSQKYYVLCFLILAICTGVIFFAGQDILLVIFALTLANVFLVMAAYSTYSPYSYFGAERELIQMMAYEPMVILMAVGIYMVTGSFQVGDIVSYQELLIWELPGIFLGFLFILTIKFRKSPFDLSMSHHAHQEIVRGLLTEFTGVELAMVEVAHWYENIFLLGLVYLFFGANPVLAVVVTLFGYFLELVIDNTTARLNWKLTLKSSWLVAAVLGSTNIAILYLLN